MSSVLRIGASCSVPPRLGGSPCPRPVAPIGLYPLPIPNSGIVPPWLVKQPVIGLPVLPVASGVKR